MWRARIEKTVADRLDKEWVTKPVRVHAIEEYYRVSENEFGRLLKSKGYREEEVGTHAGLADTSLMLAVDPRLVRTDRLQPGAKLESGDGVNGIPAGRVPNPGNCVDLIVMRDGGRHQKGHRPSLKFRPRDHCAPATVLGFASPCGFARLSCFAVGRRLESAVARSRTAGGSVVRRVRRQGARPRRIPARLRCARFASVPATR